MERQEKDLLNFPFLFAIILFRFLIDFFLLYVLRIESTRFRAITSKMDDAIGKIFNKKRFVLIAPDFVKLIAYGYKEAKFLSFLIFEIYLRRTYETYFKATKSSRIVIFDIGANMGVFALKTAKKIRDKGVVVAIEPYSYNYKRLQENVHLNRLSNIIVLGIALGEVNGTIPLWLPPSNEENTGLASTKFEISNNFIQVPVKTLAYVMKELNVQSIDLVKLDAEGAELAILKGLGGNLRKIRNLVIAAEHFPEEANELSNYLGSRGFKVQVKSIGNLPYVYAKVIQEHEAQEQIFLRAGGKTS